MQTQNDSVENKNVTCTWSSTADCDNCQLNGFLHCKWQQKHLMYFLRIAFYIMIPSFVGFILAGLLLNNWLYLIIYIAFWIVFFGAFEIRVLCSHCPYYQEEKQGLILHCLANHGTLKLWKYHPEPMKTWEKIAFIVGVLIFIFFPVIPEFDLIIQESNQLMIILLILLTGITILTGINFYYKLRKNICPYCVNFSCPFNTVEKEAVDTYLQKNPVMKDAWEKSGYKLG